MRVLVVEDSSTDADLLQIELARRAPAIRLEIVTTVAAALERLEVYEKSLTEQQHGCYDLVLTDWRLPDDTGLAVVAHVRERQLPLAVVVFTGSGDQDIVLGALRSGADDYVAKRGDYLATLPETLRSALLHSQSQLGRRHRPLRVLYGEPNPEDAARTVRELAMRAPYFVFTIRQTAAEIVQEIDRELPDLLLLDYRLPDSFASDLIKELYQVRRLSLPIVIVTGHGDEESARLSLKLGASDYLRKSEGYLQRLPTILDNAWLRAESKGKEVALQEERARLAGVIESAMDAIITVDGNQTVVLFNQAAEKLFGCPSSQALGCDVRQFFAPDSGPTYVRDVQALTTSLPGGHAPCRLETLRGVNLQGGEFPMEVSLSRVDLKEGPLYTIILRDVTERLEAARQLREQASLLDKARDAIFVFDLDHRVTFWNTGAERLYGWTGAEALGRSAPTLLGGELIAYQQAWLLAEQTGSWSGEMLQVAKDDRELRVECRWTLMSDEQGRPQSLLAIHTDVTEFKLLELQFLRSQRMESIGTLAGGIAHDLNNALAPIVLGTELLTMACPGAENERLIEVIAASAQRGSDMVKRLLSFARGLQGLRTDVDINQVLSEVSKIANETFLQQIRVRTEVCRDPWIVRADSTQIHQILLNLLVNARDAMPAGGDIVVRVDNVDLEPSDGELEASAGPYLRVSLEDSGSGITTSDLARIFEPFFSTKGEGKGTGLGLPSVLAIVKSHGGFLRVDSVVGRGTKFEVYLPARRQAVALDSLIPPTPPPRGHGELILVVDDEASARLVARRTLEAYGYRVLVAKDGAEALEQADASLDPVDILFIDVVMSGLTGCSTITALTARDPDLKVLVTSGFAGEQDSTMEGYGAQDFVAKPYTAEMLLVALAKVRVDRP